MTTNEKILRGYGLDPLPYNGVVDSIIDEEPIIFPLRKTLRKPMKIIYEGAHSK